MQMSPYDIGRMITDAYQQGYLDGLTRTNEADKLNTLAPPQRAVPKIQVDLSHRPIPTGPDEDF